MQARTATSPQCQRTTNKKDNNLDHTEDRLSNCFGGDTGKNHR
jgi:hypothetical protein